MTNTYIHVRKQKLTICSLGNSVLFFPSIGKNTLSALFAIAMIEVIHLNPVLVFQLLESYSQLVVCNVQY